MTTPTRGKGIPLRLALLAPIALSLVSIVGCWGTYGDLDINKLVTTYPLVVEGTVVGVNTEGQNGVFELEVRKFWKGAMAEPVLVKVSDASRVELDSGEQYLLFLRDPAPEGDLRSGHRYVVNATPLVWNVRGDTFHVTDAGGSCCLDPITRVELAEVIEKNSSAEN